MADGVNVARAQLQRLRKESSKGGVPQGYAGPGGAPRAQQGDAEAPFSKLPPFPSVTSIIWAAPTLVDVYGLSDDFDVELERIATLWLRYTPVEANSILSLIPVVFEQGSDVATPIAVVDAALTSVTPPTLTGPWGSRQILRAEFRTPALPAAELFQVALQFDVGPYWRMAFLAAELGDVDEGGELQLGVSTSE